MSCHEKKIIKTFLFFKPKFSKRPIDVRFRIITLSAISMVFDLYNYFRDTKCQQKKLEMNCRSDNIIKQQNIFSHLIKIITTTQNKKKNRNLPLCFVVVNNSCSNPNLVASFSAPSFSKLFFLLSCCSTLCCC